MKAKLVAVIGVVILMFAGAPVAKTSAELLIKTDFDADDNPGLTSQIADSVNEVAMEYPEVHGVLVTTEPVEGAYAFAGGHTVTFNDHLISSPVKYQQMIEDDVAHGFHPPLGHCSAVQYLAYHEVAHIIHRSRDYHAIDAALSQRFGTGAELHGIVAEYSFHRSGIINPPEALAEAFASIRCNGGNWAEWELHRMLTGR